MKLGTYPATGLDPKLSAAVFAVPEGGVTPPVQGPFGWVILRNAKIIPGQSKTFEEVKDSLKADLVKARAGAKLTDIANAFEDSRGGGTPMAEAATKQGLMLHHVAAADRQGFADRLLGARQVAPFAQQPGQVSQQDRDQRVFLAEHLAGRG